MKPFLFAALAALVFATPSFAHGDKCTSCPSAKKITLAKATKPAKGEKTVTFSAPKMHCGGCAQGMQQALSGLSGVKSVNANPKTKRVSVVYLSAKQSPKTLAATLSKAGFEVKEIKAPAKTATKSASAAKSCCQNDKI